MPCHEPLLQQAASFPCGKCPACLSIRRRTWAHRIMMEMYHAKGRSTFVTLTYSDDKVPTTTRGLPTLQAEHLRDFIKRIRKRNGQALRFFACGEYGDRSGRPHYHLALFGQEPCLGGPSAREGKGVICLCKTCSDVRYTWGFGHSMVGSLSEKSAMYIAGYVVKKMTHSLDPRLDGRDREFARMSLRPGLGAVALAPVVLALVQHGLPVPLGLRHEKKIMPLGRYLRREIARKISDGTAEGIQKALQIPNFLAQQKYAVSVLREYAWSLEIRPVDVLHQITPKFNEIPGKEKTL